MLPRQECQQNRTQMDELHSQYQQAHHYYQQQHQQHQEHQQRQQQQQQQPDYSYQHPEHPHLSYQSTTPIPTHYHVVPPHAVHSADYSYQSFHKMPVEQPRVSSHHRMPFSTYTPVFQDAFENPYYPTPSPAPKVSVQPRPAHPFNTTEDNAPLFYGKALTLPVTQNQWESKDHIQKVRNDLFRFLGIVNYRLKELSMQDADAMYVAREARCHLKATRPQPNPPTGSLNTGFQISPAASKNVRFVESPPVASFPGSKDLKRKRSFERPTNNAIKGAQYAALLRAAGATSSYTVNPDADRTEGVKRQRH
ncbi:hypothetical protein BJX99DRAFT_257799 [Aspergillus californicus]